MDQSLFNQLKIADPEAQEYVYNEYYKLVYSIAFKILKDKFDASCVAIDTFERAFRKIDQFDGDNFTAWISTIARNLAYNKVRDKNRMMLVKIQENQEIEDETGNIEILKNELADFLNEKEITIVIHHNLYGHTFKKIAEDLQMPIGTVCSLHARSMDKINNINNKG